MASSIFFIVFLFFSMFNDCLTLSSYKNFVPSDSDENHAFKDDFLSYGLTKSAVRSKGNSSSVQPVTATTRLQALVAENGGQLTYGLGEPYFYSYAHDCPMLWTDVEKYVTSAILPKKFRFAGTLEICTLL